MDSGSGFSRSHRPSLTDVDGILVGHTTLSGRPTGCTVITSLSPFVAGVDVRGGAPGTRETDLLRSEATVAATNAVFLAGGSAFGLDVGTGIAKYLEEQGLGFQVAGSVVPIVCGAVLFDLAVGDPRIRPDAQAGYVAARSAGKDPVTEGLAGAGAGCTVGKLFGHRRSMRGGQGSWSWCSGDGLRVGALVAVNCVGDVRNPVLGTIVAGARNDAGDGFYDSMEQLRRGSRPELSIGGNTVIGVVATNAALDKAGCTQIARMAHDAIGRCIYPAHTPMDGDTLFAVATGTHKPAVLPVEIGLIGAIAADVLAVAIVRACQAAGT